MNKMMECLNLIQCALEEAGEVDFADLSRREKAAIYDRIVEIAGKPERDGDCDGEYHLFDFGCGRIDFRGPVDEYHDVREYAYKIAILVDDDDIDDGTTLEQISSAMDLLRQTETPTFVNLTPHEVVVYGQDKETVLFRIPSSGQCRVTTDEQAVGEIGGVPVVRTRYLEVKDLPDPVPGTVYIVSVIVLQALHGTRSDVVAPNTSPRGVVRDAGGQILGCTSFTTL